MLSTEARPLRKVHMNSAWSLMCCTNKNILEMRRVLCLAGGSCYGEGAIQLNKILETIIIKHHCDTTSNSDMSNSQQTLHTALLKQIVWKA